MENGNIILNSAEEQEEEVKKKTSNNKKFYKSTLYQTFSFPQCLFISSYLRL